MKTTEARQAIVTVVTVLTEKSHRPPTSMDVVQALKPELELSPGMAGLNAVQLRRNLLLAVRSGVLIQRQGVPTRFWPTEQTYAEAVVLVDKYLLPEYVEARKGSQGEWRKVMHRWLSRPEVQTTIDAMRAKTMFRGKPLPKNASTARVGLKYLKTLRGIYYFHQERGRYPYSRELAFLMNTTAREITNTVKALRLAGLITQPDRFWRKGVTSEARVLGPLTDRGQQVLEEYLRHGFKDEAEAANPDGDAELWENEGALDEL